jgi:uncharacterized membrane protein YraQ (UPF0718 family)
MMVLYGFTIIAMAVSLFKSPDKTRRALTIAWRRFIKVAPAFIQIVMAASIILTLVPEEFIANCLGRDNRWVAMLGAVGLGSILLLPGFIAFPLAGMLLSQGAAYMVLSALTSSMMMVGLVTLPLERIYFGVKVTLLRNLLGLVIALAVALVTGLVFGELS